MPSTLRVLLSFPALACLVLVARPADAAPGDNTREGIEQAALDARDRAREGYERLSRRRTFDIDGVPYGATAMPITFFTPSSGLHYGGWLEVANYGREPYVYRANVQWYLTTKGKRNHHMRLEFPTPFGLPLNARFLTRDAKNTGANFFGIGNDTEIDETRTERENDYYRYLLEQQQTAFDLEYAELEPVVLFSGVRFNRGLPSRINEAKADAYYVFNLPASDIKGRSGGWANFFLLGLMYDSRNDQEQPTGGLLSEISMQLGGTLLWADYTFHRITLINTHYWEPPRLSDWGPYVLVTRVVYETLSDDAPFFELTEVGGSIRGVEVGGGSFMRGYRSRRFADQNKALYSLELRRTFQNVRWCGHYFRNHRHPLRRCGPRRLERVEDLRSCRSAPEWGHRLPCHLEQPAQPARRLRDLVRGSGAAPVLRQSLLGRTFFEASGGLARCFDEAPHVSHGEQPAQHRAQIVPGPSELTQVEGCEHGAGGRRCHRVSWARLLASVFQYDVTVCPSCSGHMKIVAALTEPRSVIAYLDGVGLSSRAPPITPAHLDRQLEFDEAA